MAQHGLLLLEGRALLEDEEMRATPSDSCQVGGGVKASIPRGRKKRKRSETRGRVGGWREGSEDEKM
jgi:hypothetical protein